MSRQAERSSCAIRMYQVWIQGQKNQQVHPRLLWLEWVVEDLGPQSPSQMQTRAIMKQPPHGREHRRFSLFTAPGNRGFFIYYVFGHRPFPDHPDSRERMKLGCVRSESSQKYVLNLH